MDTVSNAAVKDLVDTGLELGVLTHDVLKELSIFPSVLQDPTLRSSEDLLIKLWRCIDANVSVDCVGLKIGKSINSSSKGVLASWVSQSETLEEALAIFAKNIALMSPSENWAITDENGFCTLTLSMDTSKGYPAIAIERSLSAMVTWGRALCGKGFDVCEARFSYGAPRDVSEYFAVFGENLTFDAVHNQIVFNRNILSLPVVSRNAFLKGVMERAADDVRQGIEAQVSFKARVEDVIEGVWEAVGEVSTDEVCARLALSRQTLFRKLKAEGEDFRGLVEQFKKQKALVLLQSTSLNITGVSLSLGYKDSSSFNKAFKRWYGVSPKSYLKSK